MRSVFFFSLAVSVASVFSQQPFVRYQEKLRRAVPHHYNHDEKNIDRGLDQVARRHQVEPHQPPLQPRQEVPWQRWVHEGRWAAQADKNTELHKVRAHLLAEKLKPNQFVFKPRVNPQLKPKLDRKVNARVKREVENGVKRETKNTNAETIKEERKEEHVRHKRDLSMIQPEPEINVQPELEAKSPNDQYDGRTRSKRQIVLFLPQPPPQQLMARSPRTTPNPFVRDTHVDDYDIIRPNRGEREGMIPSVEGGSGSDTLVNEDSSEFSKTIAQFFITTSEEHWPGIRQFAENILKPLSRLTVKKEELHEALKSVVEPGERVMKGRSHDVVEMNEKSVQTNSEEAVHNRVKRRVNKTLQRKRAKKKKQRLRRFEAKRLRMLTHARRVRRQQKSKQARLARHYARMNMSTTERPKHFGNGTTADDDKVDREEDRSRSKEEEEEEESEEEEDEEYESSEYEDKSEESGSGKSAGRTANVSENSEEEEESDESDTEDSGSELGSKPDYGNDDYDEYEDDSDEDYSEENSEEEAKKKKKKNGGESKKLKTTIRNGRERLEVLGGNKFNQGGDGQRKNRMKNTLIGENAHLAKGKMKEIQKNDYEQNNRKDLKSNREQNLEKHTLQQHRGRTKSNNQWSKINVGIKNSPVGRIGTPT